MAKAAGKRPGRTGTAGREARGRNAANARTSSKAAEAAKEAQSTARPARSRQAVRLLRTGLAAKLIILALLAAVGCRLYALQGQVASAQQERDRMAELVEIQRQKNDALAEDIAEGATPEKMQEIARRELGLVFPGEYVFSIGN